MKNPIKKILIAFVCLINIISIHLHGQCDRMHDSLELVKLYNSTDGPNWKIKWILNTPMDMWWGVKISQDGCSVIQLSLGSLNLKTDSIINLKLTNLEYLDLSYNQIEGNISNFSSLPTLTRLNLRGNYFSGVIPNFVLPKLEELELSYNELTGTIPNFNSIPNIKSLHLSANNLKGKLPDFSNIPKLNNLYVFLNNLYGDIPSFENLPDLEELYLGNNYFTGFIPDFKSLSNLKKLDIRNNFIRGNIPNFSNLPKLITLNLSKNQLSGTIPLFTDLPELLYLQLGGNRLVGSIPYNINTSNLLLFDLSDNKLTGSIPIFSELTTLFDLNVSNNLLGGKIQIPLSLKNLDISHNFFTFEDIIPIYNKQLSFFNYDNQNNFNPGSSYFLRKGEEFVLNLKIDSFILDNKYTWYKDKKIWIPPIENTPNSNSLVIKSPNIDNFGRFYVEVQNDRVPGLILRSVDMSFMYCDTALEKGQLINLFDATNGMNWFKSDNWKDIDVPLSNWYGVKTNSAGCVEVVDLNTNNLDGPLPSLLLSNLHILELSNNKISGSIPNNIKTPFIESLNLRNNRIEGLLPNVIGGWLNLRSFNIGLNHLTGEIPPDLGDLCELNELKLDSNEFIGELPVELTKLQKLKIGNVDFRYNDLDSLKDKIIFFCPFDTIILKYNSAFIRFKSICNKVCLGTEWDKSIKLPWLNDALSNLNCSANDSCNFVKTEAGFVDVRGLKIIYIKNKCCLDSTCRYVNVETRFFDCSGNRIETAVCYYDGLCLTDSAIAKESIDTLVFDPHWECGSSSENETSISWPVHKYDGNLSFLSECFPNPIFGKKIKCYIAEATCINSIKMVDLSGREIHGLSWKLDNDLLIIDIPEVDSNVYILEVHGCKVNQHFKIITE